jgi:hypothetical protein
MEAIINNPTFTTIKAYVQVPIILFPKGVVSEYPFFLFLNILTIFLVLRELKINEEKILFCANHKSPKYEI